MKKCLSSIWLRGCLIVLATSTISSTAAVLLDRDVRFVSAGGGVAGTDYADTKNATAFLPFDATASGSVDSPQGSRAASSASQISTVEGDHITAMGHLEATANSRAAGDLPAASATASLEVTFQVVASVFFTLSGTLTHVANEGGTADGSLQLDSPTQGVVLSTNSTGTSGATVSFILSGLLQRGTYTLHARQGVDVEAHSLHADYQWDLQVGGFFYPPTAHVSFTNSGPIQIAGRGPASPYPSTLLVDRLRGVIGHVSVQLNGLTHTAPRHLGILLAGPNGDNTILMAGVGGTDPIRALTLGFDADTPGGGQIPPDGPLFSATYVPSGGDEHPDFPFSPPASPGPYGDALTSSRGKFANGSWSLFVYNDGDGDQGTLAGGWSITIDTIPDTPPQLFYVPAVGAPQELRFPDLTISPNTLVGPVRYSVFDTEQSADRLTVSVHSSDQKLVPDSNLILGDRVLNLTLAPDQTGLATITLTASDGVLETNASFTITVLPTEPPRGAFTNSTAITIPDHGSGNPYPSTIQVGGLAGVVSSLTVELNGLSHTWPKDLGFLLVGPDGEKALLMVNSGGGHPVSNITLLLDDSAANPLPEWDQLVSGRYQPIPYRTDWPFPAPAPPGPYQANLKLFSGYSPNGVWSLYTLDNAVADQGILAGGWSLTITTTLNTPPTLHYFTPHGDQPAFPDQSTFANLAVGPIGIFVNDVEQRTNQLTITGHSSNPTLIPDSSIVVRERSASYFYGANIIGDVMLIPTPDQTGTATITLTATDGFAQTSASFQLQVVNPPYQAKMFANSGSIVIPDHGTATPYPSTIQVSGLSGAVTKVTVRLYEFTHLSTPDLRLLLVSPTGERAILMDHASSYPASAVNVITGFDDSGELMDYGPEEAFYHPTIGRPERHPIISTVPLPAPAPAPPYRAELEVFRAIPPNGTWALYVDDDVAQDPGLISGGWELTIETSPSPTPVLSSIPDQTLPMNTVSAPLPFTVEDALTPADELFVSSTSSNPALIPDANILLSGSGTNRAVIVTPLTSQTGSAEIRISATNLTQVGASVSFVVNVTSQGAFMTFANPAAITIPDQGAASPYPSTINVTGLSGVINDVTVTLYNLSHTWPHDVGVLLVSPGGSASVLMADVGGGNPAQAVALQFDDAAASSLTQGPLLAGSYRPTSFDSHDPFPSPAPAGPYPATLSVFNGLSPNGTWSLYVLDDAAQDHGQIADGWSLSLSTAPVAGLMSLRVNPDPTDPLISVNRAARFESMAVLPNGHFSATIRSPASQGYVLQASPDGIVWLDLLTNAEPADAFSFSDAHALGYDHRFYRLRMLEAPPASLSR